MIAERFTMWLRWIAVTVVVAGIPAGNAAPLVPPGDQPGRERYRFTPSPLERFMSRLHRIGRCCGGTVAVAAPRDRSSEPGALGIVEVGQRPTQSGSRRLLHHSHIRRHRLLEKAAQDSVERQHALAILTEAADRDCPVGCLLAAHDKQRR